MAIVKKTNSDYVIQTTRDTSSNVTFDTDYVYVKGNLTVFGNTTTVTSQNLAITDNIITLNEGETGAGVTKGTAGITVFRGLSANVSVLWNESVDKWQITNDGINYANISASYTATGNLSLKDDPDPFLNANLNVHGYTINSNVGGIQFDGNLQINYSSNPSAPTNAIALYSSAPGSAGSGLYVVNTNGNDELVTKTKAIVYSLIL